MVFGYVWAKFNSNIMGIFKKVVKLATGGDQVCKYCGQKKSLMSSDVCRSGERQLKKHVWIKA